MKKFLMAGLLLLALAGCESEDDYNKIESVVTVTDVKIDLEYKDGDRYTPSTYYVSYGKQESEKSKKFEVTYNLANNIEKIKKMERLTDSEETLYDVVTDGEHIVMVILSKNRK